MQDVLDAAAYAARRTRRSIQAAVYLVGVSGGGHMALLMAGRVPDRWTAVSAWVPVSDLAAWHAECRGRGPALRRRSGALVRMHDQRPHAQRRRAPETARPSMLNTTPARLSPIFIPISAPLSTSTQAFSMAMREACRSAIRCGCSTPWRGLMIESARRTSPTSSSGPLCLQVYRGEVDDPLYGEKRVLFRRQAITLASPSSTADTRSSMRPRSSWLAGHVKRDA